MIKMIIQIDYINVIVVINTDTKKITVKDHTNSNKLFDMIFKAILNKINIDVNNYTIIKID